MRSERQDTDLEGPNMQMFLNIILQAKARRQCLGRTALFCLSAGMGALFELYVFGEIKAR